MPNLGNITKSLKGIFGLSGGLKSRLLELKKKRNINKRKRYVENLITLKGNATKVTTNKVNKKSNECFWRKK